MSQISCGVEPPLNGIHFTWVRVVQNPSSGFPFFKCGWSEFEDEEEEDKVNARDDNVLAQTVDSWEKGVR